MRIPKEKDWNFFGALPSNLNELIRMCVWEYARECRPLIDAIAKFKAIPEPPRASRTRLARFNREQQRLLAPINKIAGRFDWGFLCARDFPSKPWLSRSARSSPQARDSLFTETKVLQPTDPYVEVKHGKKTRKQKVEWRPFPPRFFGDVSDCFENGNREVFDRLDQFVASVMAEQFDLGCNSFHCLVIPDSFFEIVEPDVLAAAIKHMCRCLDRRQLAPDADRTAPTLKRPNYEAFLRWLGIMRFYHLFDSEKRQQILDHLRKTPAKLNVYTSLAGANHAEARNRATRSFKRIFKVPPDCLPLSREAK